MTQIEFHFNAPNKLAYVCRLLRKGVAQSSRLFVVAEMDMVERLDNALWALSPTDFVSHCVGTSNSVMTCYSSVIIGDELQLQPGVSTAVNLRPDVPAFFEQFDRMIEVVTDDPSDRAEARARWKKYTKLGYSLIRRDLNLKANG